MEVETFKTTVVPLREKLLNFSLKYMDEKADAEDIVQETFLKLWYMRDKLDTYRSIEALAIQITKNLSIDKLRSKKTTSNDFDSLYITSPNHTPADITEQQDTADYIRKLINELPSLQRVIIQMKDIEGYELNEIAEITGSQPEAIRVNLSRARKKIREKFLGLNQL